MRYEDYSFSPVIKKNLALAGKRTLDLSSKLIIIAEDDPYSYLYVNQLLKDTHAELIHVNDGSQLMELLEQRIPDIILLDINMPIKNGYDCLREIRERKIQTRIIVQTAYAMSDERERIMDAGADNYLSKPIRKPELYEMIESVLGNPLK